MKKRISALLLSGALCLTLNGNVFAGAAGSDKLSATLSADGGKISISAADGEQLTPGEKYGISVFRTAENGREYCDQTFIVTVDSDGKLLDERGVELDISLGTERKENEYIRVAFGDTDGNTWDRYVPPKETNEESDDEPGESGSEPGESGSEPGESGSEPGESGSEPGESGSEPGESGSESGGESSGESGTRPVNPDTPSSGGSSGGSSSGGSSSGGSSSSSTNPNPIKYNKRTDKQTPTQITTPNTGWTSTGSGPMVFFDVQTSDWFANAVNYVTQNGMMVGSNGKFSPNDRLTRGMMAQILYNMEGTPAAGTASFPDVNSSDWFANAVAWASANGCMSGYENGRFGPNDPITREQLAAILYRYSGTKGYSTAATAELSGFVDGNTTSAWASTSMRWAVTSGLLSGKSGNRLDPTGTATRAEVAQILMNFCTKIAQ